MQQLAARPLFLTTQALPLDHTNTTATASLLQPRGGAAAANAAKDDIAKQQQQHQSSAVAQFAALSPTKQALALAAITKHQQHSNTNNDKSSPTSGTGNKESSPMSLQDFRKYAYHEKKKDNNKSNQAKKRSASEAAMHAVEPIDPEAEKERIRKRNVSSDCAPFRRHRLWFAMSVPGELLRTWLYSHLTILTFALLLLPLLFSL